MPHERAEGSFLLQAGSRRRRADPIGTPCRCRAVRRLRRLCSCSAPPRGAAPREARAALEQVPERIGPGEPKVEAFAEWTVIRQEGKVGATAYSVVDAKRRLTESAVAVRIAWPHLPGNPADYDHQMEALLRRVLASSYEHVGPYQPREGERILRPLE
jgi:hypothetical protein